MRLLSTLQAKIGFVYILAGIAALAGVLTVTSVCIRILSEHGRRVIFPLNLYHLNLATKVASARS